MFLSRHYLAAAAEISLTLAGAAPARGELEFVGILITAEKTVFAVHETADDTTEWRALGQQFSGYTLRAFDARTDTLTFVKDKVERTVRLKNDAKIKEARLELTGAVTFETGENVQVVRATLIVGEENVFPLAEGVTYRITPRRMPEGTISYQTSIERTRGPNKIEKLSAPGIVTLPGQQFRVQMDDVGLTFSMRVDAPLSSTPNQPNAP